MYRRRKIIDYQILKPNLHYIIDMDTFILLIDLREYIIN